jgi:hypothetical protein
MSKGLKNLFLIGTGSYLAGFLFLFLTGSIFYFGEAISYEGLMRMLSGLPFASSPTELPVSLTPYSPLFLLPLTLLGKLLHIHSIEKAIILARFYQSMLLGILFLSLNRMRNHFFPLNSSGSSFLLACSLVFFYSPAMELALRPDTISFLCECWAIYFILYFLKTDQDRFLGFAALSFSLALAFKLNTLGCFLGASGFLLCSKQWSSFLKLTLSTLLLTSLFLGLHQIFLAEVFSKNILVSIQSQLWQWAEALEVYLKLFKSFLLPLSIYFFLVIRGIRCFEDKEQSRLFAWILSASFLMAFLGQMKWGAFHNYFLGMLYLGIIPASCGIFRLARSSPRLTYGIVGSLMLLFMARELSIPYKIWLDKRYFFELTRLQELVREKAPSGFIYSNDEKIKVGFVGRSALGVLTEELLWTTPKFRPLIPLLKNSLINSGGPQAFITLCSETPPREWGFSATDNWEKIQTGKYCLYANAK